MRQVFSRQGRTQRRWNFLAQLPEWREAGLVGFSKGTKINDYGWPLDGNDCAFTWCAGEDLTRLLDTMITMRLHSRPLEYHSRLRNLRSGATPEFEQVAVSVQLCVRQNRVRLIHWIREDMMAAARRNRTNGDEKILVDLSVNYDRLSTVRRMGERKRPLHSSVGRAKSGLSGLARQYCSGTCRAKQSCYITDASAEMDNMQGIG